MQDDVRLEATATYRLGTIVLDRPLLILTGGKLLVLEAGTKIDRMPVELVAMDCRVRRGPWATE